MSAEVGEEIILDRDTVHPKDFRKGVGDLLFEVVPRSKIGVGGRDKTRSNRGRETFSVSLVAGQHWNVCEDFDVRRDHVAGQSTPQKRGDRFAREIDYPLLQGAIRDELGGAALRAESGDEGLRNLWDFH